MTVLFRWYLYYGHSKESLLDAQSPSERKRMTDQVPEKDETKLLDNCNKTDNGNIKYVVGKLNSNDLYALPNKRMGKTNAVQEAVSDDDEKYDRSECKSKDSIEEKDSNNDLPFGWEKHEDNDGPYYWHIKSGTIQREPPTWPRGQDAKELKSPTASNVSPIFSANYNNATNKCLLRVKEIV